MHSSIASRAQLGAVSLLFVAGNAFAQVPGDKLEESAPEALREKVLADDPKEEDGWKLKANVGASFSFNKADNVVGVDNGVTIAFGGVFGFSANLKAGHHRWENSLALQHAQTKTPSLQPWIKSLDNFEIKTAYFYRFDKPKWLGPFGKAKLQTSLLPGYAVKAEPVTVIRDGVPDAAPTPGQTKIALTDGFQPLLIRYSGGAFANPFEKDEFTLKSRLGLGAQHIIGTGAYAVSDDADTPELELTSIGETNDFGGVLEVDLLGQIVKDVLSWSVETEFFYPFVSSSDAEFDVPLNMDINGKLSLKLNKWLSFDYSLLVRHVPAVAEVVQVQNQILLNVSFEIL